MCFIGTLTFFPFDFTAAANIYCKPKTGAKILRRGLTRRSTATPVTAVPSSALGRAGLCAGDGHGPSHRTPMTATGGGRIGALETAGEETEG